MPQDLRSAFAPSVNAEGFLSLMDSLARQPVAGVNYHEPPQGLRPSWIQEQTIEPVPFGSLADPVSQLAFLGASPLMRAFSGMRAPGPMPLRSTWLAGERGSTGEAAGGGSMEELKRLFLERGGVESGEGTAMRGAPYGDYLAGQNRDKPFFDEVAKYIPEKDLPKLQKQMDVAHIEPVHRFYLDQQYGKSDEAFAKNFFVQNFNRLHGTGFQTLDDAVKEGLLTVQGQHYTETLQGAAKAYIHSIINTME